MSLPRIARSVVLIALTVSVASGLWFAAQWSEYRQQQQIGGQISQHGGAVGWSDKTPKWLSWLCRPNVCQRITSVGFDGRMDIALALDAMSKLPDCHSMRTSNDTLTEAVLGRLDNMAQMTSIEVIDDRPRKPHTERQVQARLPLKTIHWQHIASPYGRF